MKPISQWMQQNKQAIKAIHKDATLSPEDKVVKSAEYEKELIDLKFKDLIKVDICRKVDLNRVPNAGEEVTVSWKHNLNNGAEPIIIDDTDEFISEVRKIALDAGKAVNIKFATIDVAVTQDKKVLIMEINASVCMNKFSEIVPGGYEIAKNVYAKAIDKMFE